MPLTHITHIGDTLLFEMPTWRAQSHDRRRLLTHAIEHGADGRRIQLTQAHVTAAHDLVGDRSIQETDGGTDTGIGGNDDRGDTQLLGQARGVHRRGAAKGDQCAPAQILAALDGMHPGCIRHVLVHHLADGEGRQGWIQIQRLAHVGVDSRARGAAVQREAAAGETIRIDASQQHIGIGYRGA